MKASGLLVLVWVTDFLVQMFHCLSVLKSAKHIILIHWRGERVGEMGSRRSHS